MFWSGQVMVAKLESLQSGLWVPRLYIAFKFLYAAFQVKGRNYYMEVLDSMWFLSNLRQMNTISRITFSLGQILLSCV